MLEYPVILKQQFLGSCSCFLSSICDVKISLVNTVWKVSKYGVFSGLYFPIFGLNTEIYAITLVGSWVWVLCSESSILDFMLYSHVHVLGLLQKMTVIIKCDVTNMWCVARFDSICTILKTWKTPMEEC